MGRIPKVEKEKALEVFHQGGSDFKNLEIEVEMTGTGTYDFKINPKDEGNKFLQTGSHDQSTQMLQNAKADIQSDNPETVPSDLEIQQDNDVMETEQIIKGNYPYTSMQMSRNLTNPCVTENPARVSGEFPQYPNSQAMPDQLNYPSGQRLCDKSLTICSQEFVNSTKSQQIGFSSDGGHNSNQYAFVSRNKQDSFKVPFDSFNTCEAMYAKTGRNFEQWQCNKNTLASHHRYDLNYDSNSRHAPCGNPDFSSFPHSEITGQKINVRSVTQTGTAVESQFVPHFNTMKQHSTNPSVNQSRLHTDMSPRFHSIYNKEQFQPFLHQKDPSLHIPSATVTKSPPELCYVFTAGNLPLKNVKLDYEMTPMNRNAESLSLKMDQAVQQSPVKSTDAAQGSFQKLPHKRPTNETDMNAPKENQSETLKTEIDNYAESIENLRCSSPGSVLSREGSNSSQRSGYSTAIIQILLDQLLESDQVATFARSLEKKLDTPQAEVVERLLKLVNDASERTSKHSGESEILSKLPEDKLESMNRFLKDLNNSCNKNEAPLLKKKRCVEETELKESFENLDVEKPVEMFMTSKEWDKPEHITNREPSPLMLYQSGTNHVINSSQGSLSTSNVRMNSHDKFVPSGTEIPSLEISCNHDIHPIQLSKEPVPSSQIQSQNMAANHNSAYSNSQQGLKNEMAPYNVQNEPAYRKPKSVTNQGLCARTFINTVKQMALNNSLISDSVVSSTVSQEKVEVKETKSDEEMLATINCMNLAMKILNRFKPEHREKIRLFKQGQVNLIYSFQQ
jgi:hypothetical protein